MTDCVAVWKKCQNKNTRPTRRAFLFNTIYIRNNSQTENGVSQTFFVAYLTLLSETNNIISLTAGQRKMYSKIFIIGSTALPPTFSVPHTIKAGTMHGFSYYWSGRIRVYKNKPRAVRTNTRIHADLSSFDDKSSERFEPRQTAVCRLNPHGPPRKLKPPHLRRFEFSGRSVNTC